MLEDSSSIIALRNRNLTPLSRCCPAFVPITSHVRFWGRALKMRVLEHGGKVKMAPTQYSTHAVDHPSDVEIVERALRTESES